MKKFPERKAAYTLSIRRLPNNFSDGIHEALSADDEEFGEARLERVILEAKDEEPRQVRDRILHAVAEHSRGVAPADDVTVVVAKAR